MSTVRKHLYQLQRVKRPLMALNSSDVSPWPWPWSLRPKSKSLALALALTPQVLGLVA